MPSDIFKTYKHELHVLSNCDKTVFKALVDSDKEIIELILEILDNVANIRLSLDNETLGKLSKKYKFFEKVLSTKSVQAAKVLLLKDIKITQVAIKAALPVIDHD